jgi:hypothetical protein
MQHPLGRTSRRRRGLSVGRAHPCDLFGGWRHPLRGQGQGPGGAGGGLEGGVLCRESAQPASPSSRPPLSIPAQRVRPPASIALDQDSGQPPAVGHGRWRGGTRLRRVLLRWQAPQPCPAHQATWLTRPTSRLRPLGVPTRATRVPPRRPEAGSPLVMPPRGSGASARQGALRAIESFRRSHCWRTCARAACGGNLSLPWLLRRVVLQIAVRIAPG